MPKINGKPVDPKAYAARVTDAKKRVARIDPETKRKIAEMYPKQTQSPKPIDKKVGYTKTGFKPGAKPAMPGMGPTARVAANKPTQTPKPKITPKPKPTPKPTPMPKFNNKQIQDMLTGKTPVTLNGKKPKTADELREAIRQKTGIYPNTSR